MEGHFPGEGSEPSLGQGLARAGDPAARATAFGTEDGLGLVGAGPGIDVDMLLEQPGREVTAEFDGPLLPPVEGDELILVLRIEHQVEGSGGVGQPALAKGRAGALGLGSRVVHGRPPGDRVNRTRRPGVSYPGGPGAGTRLHPAARALRDVMRVRVGTTAAETPAARVRKERRDGAGRSSS